MQDKKLEAIVENLFIILPLFKKKLVRPEEEVSHNDNNDLSPSHLQILFLLDDLGRQSISEIGKNLCISKPNMTPLIQKLIKKELIERIPSENDRRYIHIDTTEKGKIYLEGLKKSLADNLKMRLSKLKEEDLDRFSNSLHDMKEILSQID